VPLQARSATTRVSAAKRLARAPRRADRPDSTMIRDHRGDTAPVVPFVSRPADDAERRAAKRKGHP
jgi:hypothetical protein